MSVSVLSTPLPAPLPRAIRLVGARDGVAPRVPFGLGVWSDEPESALAIQLEGPAGHGVDPVLRIAAELPDPASLAAATLVVVLDTPRGGGGGILGKLFGRKEPKLSRAARCSALLSCGYVRIGGGLDPVSGLDLVWGYSA